jgi:hypothetical protein
MRTYLLSEIILSLVLDSETGTILVVGDSVSSSSRLKNWFNSSNNSSCSSGKWLSFGDSFGGKLWPSDQTNLISGRCGSLLMLDGSVLEKRFFSLVSDSWSWDSAGGLGSAGRGAVLPTGINSR